MQEQDLIARAKRGDPQAFETLIRPYLALISRIAGGILRDPDDTDDAAQDAVIRIWQKLASYSEGRGSSFRAWIGRIAANTAFSHLRLRTRGRSVVERALREAQSARTPEPAARLMVHEETDVLPPTFRAVLVLHATGHTYREIAARLVIPCGTVMSRLHRSRKQLARRTALAEARAFLFRLANR